MNAVERRVLESIPFGKKNAIDRYVLAGRVRLDERVARKVIERLKPDYAIINNSDGKGYFQPLPGDEPEVQNYLKQEGSRERKVKMGQRGARKWLKEQKKTAPVVRHRDGRKTKNTTNNIASTKGGCQDAG